VSKKPSLVDSAVGAAAKTVSSVFSGFFFFLGPDFAVDFKSNYDSKSWKKAAVASGLMALFFCFVAISFLTYLDGTLMGDNPDILYFWKDRWNLTLYLLVVPFYVAFSIAIIREYLFGWAISKTISDSLVWGDENIKRVEGPFVKYRSFFVFFVVILATLVFIISYMKGASCYHLKSCDHSVDKAYKIYWFVKFVVGSEFGIDGGIILNGTGYYYVALNAVLLFLCLLAASCFVSITIEVVKISNKIGMSDSIDAKLKTKLISFLAIYQNMYFFAKMLVYSIVFNTYVFSISPLGFNHIINVSASSVIIVFVGLSSIHIPRYWLEYCWGKYKVILLGKRHHSKNVNEIQEKIDEIYPWWVKALDYVVGGLVINSFLRILYRQLYGIPILPDGFWEWSDPLFLLQTMLGVGK
jgi:hypothetical protein